MPASPKLDFLRKKLKEEGKLDWEFVKAFYGCRAKARPIWIRLQIEGLMDRNGNYIKTKETIKEELKK